MGIRDASLCFFVRRTNLLQKTKSSHAVRRGEQLRDDRNDTLLVVAIGQLFAQFEQGRQHG